MKQVERGHWSNEAKEYYTQNVLLLWVFVNVEKLGIVGHKIILE